MPLNEKTALLAGNGVHIQITSDFVGCKERFAYEPILAEEEDYSYAALSLDELIHYKDDPWWQNMRRLFFYTFWLTIIFTFITACLLAYLESDKVKCNIAYKTVNVATNLAP